MYWASGLINLLWRLNTVPPLHSTGPIFSPWKTRWMFSVEMHYGVHRAGMAKAMSVRETSWVFGVRRDTVCKMLADATPQGHTRQGRPPSRS